MSSIFRMFPEPPGQGKVTLYEQHGEMCAMQEGHTSPIILRSAGFPEVTITKDSTRSLTQRENAKSAFLPHNETVSKRVYHAWIDMGVSGALEEVVNSTTEVPQWCTWMTQNLLVMTRWTASLHGSFFPHLALSNEDIITKFSGIPNWSAGPVKAFAWHPHTMKLSYALLDDSVRIHTLSTDLVPILKHKLQKNVACLAWQPNSSSVLAVACQSGILIWHVEPTSLATRPSSSAVQVLQQNGHCPVTSLAWSTDGRILMSASPVDTAMMAWDVALETCTPLRRFGGGGVSMLAWSPDGSKLFAATPSNLFRVWETRRWHCEKWSTVTGRCKAACWSPCGNVLLFTTENQPMIYSLTFTETRDETKPVIGGSQTAVACVDLSELEMDTDDKDSKVKVGGHVQAMVWDETGERLAVLFQDNKQYVAVFRTTLTPILEITPCGFVKGVDGEIPKSIQFKSGFDRGALLTVMWSSGRLGYVQLLYASPDSAQNPQSLQQQTHLTNITLFSTLQS